MPVQENEITANDGLTLKGKFWMPEFQPSCIVCIVHGLGEHIGRYNHVAEYFNKNNIAVFAYDLRGHGKSEGKRGHTASYDLLLDDVEIMLNKARSETNQKPPLFLYGHSLGGNIVANYIIKRNVSELSGAVISSPWLRLAFEPPAFKVILGQLMSKIYPALTQHNGIDPNDLSKDQEVVRAYIEDPLVHSKISAGMFVNAYKAGLWAIDNADKLKIPILVMHGGEDKITSAEATSEFVKNAGENAKLKIWEGLRHEPHNEIEKEEVLSYMKDWLLKER
ncbi:MAG: lysophospholipase [Bacteroidota bacterium]